MRAAALRGVEPDVRTTVASTHGVPAIVQTHNFAEQLIGRAAHLRL